MKLKSTLLSIMLCSISFLTYAQSPTPTKEYIDEFKKFIELSGSTFIYDGIVEQLIPMALPESTPEKVAEIKESVGPKVTDLIVEVMAPIYMEIGVTIDNLKDICNFYATPAGKKLGASQKELLDKSMPKGQVIVSKIQDLIKETTK